MKVSELFEITDPSGYTNGSTPYLDRGDCKIVDRKKSEDSLVLYLKRASDGKDGRAHLRVREQFEKISIQLLEWAFASSIVGLTIDQLNNLETDSEVESICKGLQKEC